jgi:hypothetical protein
MLTTLHERCPGHWEQHQMMGTSDVGVMSVCVVLETFIISTSDIWRYKKKSSYCSFDTRRTTSRLLVCEREPLPPFLSLNGDMEWDTFWHTIGDAQWLSSNWRRTRIRTWEDPFLSPYLIWRGGGVAYERARVHGLVSHVGPLIASLDNQVDVTNFSEKLVSLNV